MFSRIAFGAVKANFKLKKNAKPLFRSQSPVQYATFATFDKELDRLQQARVIQSVSYSL